jgi:hypothetical protein
MEVFKGELNHLQGTQLLQVSTDRILTGALRAIQFPPGAVWKDQVLRQDLLVAPHQAVQDPPPPLVEVHPLQVLFLQVLPQDPLPVPLPVAVVLHEAVAEVEVLLQAGDSL